MKLKYPAKNPWIKNIDILQATLNIGKVLKSKESTFSINTDTVPALVSTSQESFKVGLIDLSLKSSMLATPSIEFISNYEPSRLKAFYIDTDYGLRYKNTIYRQQKLDDKKFYDRGKIDFTSQNFPEKEGYFYQIGFAKIPKPPFNLVIEIIEKQTYAPRTLTLENISVSN